MKVERAAKKLPAWKIAELIDRLEDRRVKKQDETTKDGAKATAGFNVGLPGLGGISASVAGMNLPTASRFFKERSAKAGGDSSIRELNAVKWESGQIQPTLDEGLSSLEESEQQLEGKGPGI